MIRPASISIFFFFNDTATTEIYTLSLHDALPIYHGVVAVGLEIHVAQDADAGGGHHAEHHQARAAQHHGGQGLDQGAHLGQHAQHDQDHAAGHADPAADRKSVV